MSKHRNPRPRLPKRPPPAKRRPPYASPEEQLRELYNHIQERDRKVAESLLVIVRHLATSRGTGVVGAIGVVVDFVVKQSTSHPRRAS